MRLVSISAAALVGLMLGILSGCSEPRAGANVAPVVEKNVNVDVEPAKVTPVVAVVQDPGQLQTDGFGTLSGKVTLDSADGALPPVVNLAPIMAMKDAKCCLGPKCKDEEKIDLTWVIDPKTKAVANVMVWVKPPVGKYFAIHEKYQKRDKETIVLDQPHCQYLPHVAAFNPVYMANGKPVETGQKLIFKNSAGCAHNVRVLGDQINNKGFNNNLPPGAELANSDLKDPLKPQRLPLEVKCDIHTWMSARLFIFDHPYYAITKADGSYEIPLVPAGAEIAVFGWHEGMGWCLTSKGQAVTIEKGKTKTVDFKVKYDPNAK